MGRHRDSHLDDVDPHLIPGVRDVEGRVLGGEVVHHAWHGHLGEGGHSWLGSMVSGLGENTVGWPRHGWLAETRLAGQDTVGWPRHGWLAETGDRNGWLDLSGAAVDGQARLAEDGISHLDTVGIEVDGRGDGGEGVDLPEVALGGGGGGGEEEDRRHGGREGRRKREDIRWRSTGVKKINSSR